MVTGPDGAQIVIYGTGGNTNNGALYAISLLDLYRKNINMTRLIYRDTNKGILSPAVLMDVNGDGLQDIVLATINANVMAFDGATFECLWNRTFTNFEIINGLSPSMWDDDGTPDVMVQMSYGNRQVYQYQQTLVLSGGNGSTLATLTQDTLPSYSPPLALSLTGAGNDMFLYWSSNCQGVKPGQQIFYDFRVGTHVHEQTRADLCRALLDTGTVSHLKAVSRNMVSSPVQVYNSSWWSEFERKGAVNTSQMADIYIAKHPEVEQMLAEGQEDDNEYSVLPNKPPNYENAMKLLEEEMAREYGDGRPFIDPGSQAYQAFDYVDPVADADNDSNDAEQPGQLSPGQQTMMGGYQPVPVVPGVQQYPMMPGQYGQYPPPVIPQQQPRNPLQPGYGIKQRRRRDVTRDVRPVQGLMRQPATGTLAPSLILANDTIDIVFPVHWIYPSKVDVLHKDDIDCIANKLKHKQGDIDEQSEEMEALIAQIEEECLKKSRHFAKDDIVYETPSDYDPLSVNMGQLIVYRHTLRCKCDETRLSYNQRCATILPYDKQGWPAYMGREGDSIYRRQSR